MKRSGHETWKATAGALVLTVGLLGGCQSTEEAGTPALSEQEAVRLAERLARGYDVPRLEEYEVEPRMVDGQWHVHFVRGGELDLLGWPSRFHVRVEDDRRMQIVRGGEPE